MIKFFRKIRQNIIKENKVSKYMLYAIGEIVLVVIGILIALSINNWNEANKAKQIEQDYLTKLSVDINAMNNVYSSSLRKFTAETKEAEQALKYVESNGKMEGLKTAFESTLLTHQRLRSFIQYRSTYDEMLANGILARVSNEELKLKITDVFDEIDLSNNSISYFRDEVGRASKIINEHVLFSYNENSNLTVTYDINEFYSIIPFRNALVEIIDARMDYYWSAQLISPKIIEAKTLLEKELQLIPMK